MVLTETGLAKVFQRVRSFVASQLNSKSLKNKLMIFLYIEKINQKHINGNFSILETIFNGRI